ncbi:ATP-dependent RNA helicase dhx8 [Cytospora mali]|uniref:ATP-dependent RNA helicase dhx8 n=1 Tax=Cytospora mali TaxID=578113 RepID=A0A194VWK9_CYTMA|nr:ATP-dependent RNA helicase dhx8 [Valsa mali]
MLNEDSMSLRTGPDPSLVDLVHSAFMDPHGDHLSLFNIWEAYKFQSVRTCRNINDEARFAHLSEWYLQLWQGPEYSVAIRKRVLLKSGFLHIAVKDSKNDGYRTLGENQSGLIHPGSSLIRRDYDFIMYYRYVKTRQFYFTTVTGIDSQ